MFNNPMFYGAIMTLLIVALPALQIIYIVSGIDNVMSVVPAPACLLSLYSFGGIIIAQ